jgi:crotonobetainyl-CoA:carnitine CoA-transferase CaiB-like acyl-CoA transferase
MCRLLGRPDLAENPEYSTTPGRARHMAEIDDIVSAWTIARSKEEVLQLLNEAHVPSAPVKTAREVAHDPHLEARGFWVDIEHPRRGPTRVPISPIRLHTGGKAEIRSPAPTLGQHTEAVLAELLGLKADELASLQAQRVTEPVTAAKPTVIPTGAEPSEA